MWTATLDNTAADELVAGMIKVTITYNNTDGRTTTVTERISEPDSYKKISQDKLRELERLDAVAEFIKSPPLGVIDTTPQLTPDELAEIEYQSKRQELVIKKQDLDLGLIEQADYDASLQAAKTITETLIKS